MSEEIKLSVVVLVYNTEEYLRDCLDSLVNQTLKGIEIITVNDESPDNSLLILEEYQEKYENLTIINQKNSGGAVAGNKGVRTAKGKYVAIVDSDDIVPLDAYEKLYNEAERTSSEIVIGKANILMDGLQKEILYKKEREVWKENRVIENIEDYLDIFYDAFYWNKIFKREFLLETDSLMPPGMLYADRPMVHKAFLYAKRIAIITDLVYLWRKRGSEAVHKSISQTNSDIKNFLDRIESYDYQLNYFNSFGNDYVKNEFLKRNLDRFLFPITGVIESEKFKEVYFKEVERIFSMVDDIYDNDLGTIKNLYIYMILNGMSDELIEFLQVEPKGSILEEKGCYYWALPSFRNNQFNIPDDLFKLRKLLPQLIQFDDVKMNDTSFELVNLTIPDAFEIKKLELHVRSRLNIEETKIYDINLKDPSVNINLSDFDNTDVYDIYLTVHYDKSVDMFRVTSRMFSNVVKNITNEWFKLFFTKKNNLSLLGRSIHFNVLRADEEKIHVGVDQYPANRSLELFVQNRVSKSKVYFKTEESAFSLNWIHFLDDNATYNLYYEIHGHKFRLSAGRIAELQEKIFDWDDTSAKLYRTDKNNVSIESGTFKRKIIGIRKKKNRV